MKNTLFSITLIISLIACDKEDIASSTSEVTIDDTDFEVTDWTTETHSNDVDPNFEEVFDDNSVKRIDIVIT